MTEHCDAADLAMFGEGLLGASEAARIRAHLAACAPCRQEEARLAAVTQLLAAVPAPPMPPEVSARIEAALAAEAAARAAGIPAGATGLPVDAQPVDAGTADARPVDAGTATQPGIGRLAAGQPGTTPPGAGQPATGRPAAVAARNGSPLPGRPGQRAGAGAGVRPADRRPPGHGPRSLARSRVLLRTLAATAVMVVLGGGGYGISQLSGHASTATSGPAAAPRPAAHTPQHGPAGGIMSPGIQPGEVTISAISSGTDYTARMFGSQLATVLRASNSAASPAHRSAAHALAGGALNSCVLAVTGNQQPQLVDLASYEGHPAIIIVVAGSTGVPGRAWVVAGHDCSPTRPDILARFPVP